MGDRANIFMKEGTTDEGEDYGVYLYTHWGGSELPDVLKAALVRGRDRWNDLQYLSRIIFCEMVKGEEMCATGFGISVKCGDGNNNIIVVDAGSMEVTSKGGKVLSFESYVGQ